MNQTMNNNNNNNTNTNHPMMMPQSFPLTNITTDQIQKFLDENKQLILAIMNNQNLGKLTECAQYQALLQKNLMFLAAIADNQPLTSTPAPVPGPTISSQMGSLPHQGIPQQGGFFMQQHPQAGVMGQQSSGFPQQMPGMQFSSPQMIQPQMVSVRSGGPSGVPASTAPSEVWRGSGATDAGKDGHGAVGGSEEAAK